MFSIFICLLLSLLTLAVLGLHCCVGFCVVVVSRGSSLVVEQGLPLWAVGSGTWAVVVTAGGLSGCRLRDPELWLSIWSAWA